MTNSTLNWTTLLGRCYVPYSRKPSACIVQGESGRYYTGLRIENLSFPLTMTEDQVAICFCLSEEDKPVRLILRPGDDADRSYWITRFNLTVDYLEQIDDLVCYSNLHSTDKVSFEAALRSLTKKAVTPNSNFNVSALLETSAGYVEGVNIEFENWQKGICAERMALAKAYCLGLGSFGSLHVHADAGDLISPCGACRQVLIEHLPHNPVHLYHHSGSKSTYFTDHLLPFHMKMDSLTRK